MSEEKRQRRVIREFAENSIERLLRHPANVRNLLRLGAGRALGGRCAGLCADHLDFERMSAVSGEFIDLDYSRRSSDLLLAAPLKGRRGGPRGEVLVSILIEHQSRFDRLMPLRLLRYVLKIFDRQEREWVGAGRPRSTLRLQPVLPVVLYTGAGPWQSVGRLVDLMDAGDAFAEVTPCLAPLFLDIGALPAEELESRGGPLGSVLRLARERRAGSEGFRRLLERVLERLDELSERDQARWAELLSYLHALVYHRRGPAEVPGLERMILSRGRTAEQKQELSSMAQTYAEYLEQKGLKKGIEKGIEKGELQARRAILLRQLRSRFGDVPTEIAARIEATSDIEELDRWLDRLLEAASIADVGIA